MGVSEILERARAWTDEEVVQRVRGGETALYEILMRRHNQRLYRVTVAILRNGAEAEDVIQDAYVRAYEHLAQFEGRAPFSTWLTRIAVHEALARMRQHERLEPLEDGEDEEISMKTVDSNLDPEQNAFHSELSDLLEAAVLRLPASYRAVVMMRDIEEMSTKEAGEALELSEENIKVRLHRGHAMMRSWLLAHVGGSGKRAFPFMGERCDRVVRNVLERVGGYALPKQAGNVNGHL